MNTKPIAAVLAGTLCLCGAVWLQVPALAAPALAEVRRRLGDHVEILAVEDVGADRFVVFRLETKRPDERYVVRFRRNGQGNYEGHILENLYPSGPGRRIYSDFLRAGKDNTVYFAVWNEDPDLAQIQVLFAVGKEQQRETVTVAGEPSLTLLEFQGSATGFYADTSFLAADGSEL